MHLTCAMNRTMRMSSSLRKLTSVCARYAAFSCILRRKVLGWYQLTNNGATLVRCGSLPINALRAIHTCTRIESSKGAPPAQTSASGDKIKLSKEKMLLEGLTEWRYFAQALQEEPNKDGFLKSIESFKAGDKYRRKHLKFVRTAMHYMDIFNVEKDVEVYNAVMDVFPRGRFNTKRLLDVIWMHPHPQIRLVLELIAKMEENVVRPDVNTYNLCLEIFGKGSFPIKKLFRLVFWIDKFTNMNPYKLPEDVYKDPVKVCIAALERIQLGDNQCVSTYLLEENENEKEYLIGSVIKNQRDVLERLSTDVTLYIEGPIAIWVDEVQEEYYVLRTDSRHSLQAVDDFNKYYWQDYQEGIVIAMCMTNKKIPDALMHWVEALEKEWVLLKKFRIVFNIKRLDTEEEEYSDTTVLEPGRQLLDYPV